VDISDDPAVQYIGNGQPVLSNAPLSSASGTANWSLVSLLLAFAGLIIMVMAVSAAINRNRKDDEYLLKAPRGDHDADDDKVTVRMYGTRGLCLLLSIAAAIIGAIVFILMNDMSARMVLFNQSTMIIAILLAATMISAKLSPKTEEEEGEWEVEAEARAV
jgi:hypothetical protein